MYGNADESKPEKEKKSAMSDPTLLERMSLNGCGKW
jgi:hypothetical protein